LQDQYDRALDPRKFKTVVLENDFLKATFMIETGGRLWSLVDKVADKELLFKNPVYRPANLAARDAWFSGGIEWNISIIGHCPFTCSPLFAAKLKLSDGTPVLRLYEWDRIRCLPFQMDFFLPEKSRFLFVRTRITNPWPRTLPIYWWSNVAVPETPDMRVLGPATDALQHAYDGTLVSHPLPNAEGMDVSYAGKRPYVRDLYFKIQNGQRPWITSIDAAGYGLVQTSTDRLIGRKVFSWGLAHGGRHWQDFLSLPGKGAYVETQAGLAPTQSEYVRMPANTHWDWLEAYGGFQVDPARGHSPNWIDALSEVETKLETALPRAQIDQLYNDTENLPDQSPEEVIQTASGWGALERKRREKFHEPVPAVSPLPFPDSTLGDDQAPWLALLEKGTLPPRKPSDLPLSPIVQPEWRTLVENSLKTKDGDHWLSWYQAGIMRFGAGDFEAAAKAWETSIERTPNAWSYRNLAVLARKNNKLDKAAKLMEQAWELQPKSIPITIEFAKALYAADRPADVCRLIVSLPPDMQANGRLRLQHAQAALATGDLETVRKFFEKENEIPNMREKEVSLSTLWFDYHAKRIAAVEKIPIDAALQKRVRAELEPPEWVDFRASTDE
jgi:tetratricopeptide (TPR) repeat protein